MNSKWIHLSFLSIFLAFLFALVMPSHLVGQTVLNFAQNGGVADHVGIKFGSCTYPTGSTVPTSCTSTEPVTCSTVAGSNQYTISGYTPTAADVGKHLIIGTAYGINGNTSDLGAGGSAYAGEPLRVLVSSVSGHTITGAAFTNGSPSANAANTIAGAECDLETDNAPALQKIVDSGNGIKIVIPAGAWGFDTGVAITKNNINITCNKGAVIYDARNDSYYQSGVSGTPENYEKQKLFVWAGATGGGMNGCTYVGTNPFIRVSRTPHSKPGEMPNSNEPVIDVNSNQQTFQNLIGMNMWSDAFITLTGNENYPLNGIIGSSHNTVKNIFTQMGWDFGVAMSYGSHNTFTNIVNLNDGIDLEPNSSVEADQTFGNSFNGVQSIVGYPKAYSGGTVWSTGGTGYCLASATCTTGQSVSNVTFTGSWIIYPACIYSTPGNNATGTIQGTWQHVSITDNGSGAAVCECGTNCTAP
jgi:hypothetical protein